MLSLGWIRYGDGGADATKCEVAGTGSGAGQLLGALRDDQVRTSIGRQPDRQAVTRRIVPIDKQHTTPQHHNPTPIEWAQVYFGALRARLGSDSRPRLLSFLWVGPGVGPLRRGKAALHRNAVRDGAMEGGSMLRGEVSLWDEGGEAAVTEVELAARVRAALGAAGVEEDVVVAASS